MTQLRSEVRRPAVTLRGMAKQARGPLLPGLRPAAEASPRTSRREGPKLATLSGTVRAGGVYGVDWRSCSDMPTFTRYGKQPESGMLAHPIYEEMRWCA